MAARILIVDDEPSILATMAPLLRARGYDVSTATTGHAALEAVDRQPPQLVILDLGLPDLDGIEVARRLREGRAIPILVLSARGAEQDKVAALDAGADDYVTKPFGVDELLARLRAALRRTTPSGEPVVTVGRLTLDLEKHRLAVDGEPTALTPNEYDLLRLFMRNEGKLLTHPAILREVWGPAYGEESNYLHVYVSHLRRKIEPDPARPRYLLTEPGVGYRLVDPSTR